MSEIKLLPCPFCSGEALECKTKIICSECSCTVYGRNIDIARKLWNTRKQMERILERLEKRKKQLEELYKSGYGTTIERLQCNDFLITTENDIRIVKEEGGIE